jgi:hypothetical protein
MMVYIQMYIHMYKVLKSANDRKRKKNSSQTDGQTDWNPSTSDYVVRLSEVIACVKHMYIEAVFCSTGSVKTMFLDLRPK